MREIRCPACGRRLFDADLRDGGTTIQIECPRPRCQRLVRIHDDGRAVIVADRHVPAIAR